MPMPSFAPYECPTLICADCGHVLRKVIGQHKNGKVQGITYFCDTCKYGHVSSMPHHNGQFTKHEPPKPPAGADKPPAPQDPAGRVGGA